LAVSLFDELKRRNVLRVGAAYAVTAWLIIQVAETLFPLFGFDDTPARIVVIVLAIGAVPLLIFAWAFEWTPEGLRRERDVDRGQSISPQTGRRLDRVIMVVLALALGYFAFDKFVLSVQREEALEVQQRQELEQARQAGRRDALVESYGDRSIAVLAFADMSPGADQEYLSDGIAEELLNLLARIPQLRVISRSSAFSFKGQNLDVTEIARRLDVSHVLEGSVRQSGDRVRITTQLIDARTDTHLWSETYDRQLDDIFAIEDDIAARVVEQLKIKLLGAPPEMTVVDPRAYSLYLQARHLSDQVTAEALAESVKLYRQALAIDPAYAAAWNGLSVTYFRLSRFDASTEQVSFSQAREAVDRALALDPDYAAAHAHAAWLDLFQANDLAAAARSMQQALSLSPADPWIVGRAAAVLFNLGRLDEAIAFGDYEISRDPLFMPGFWNQGLRYLAANRWEEAIEAYRTVLRLGPGSSDGWWGIGQAQLGLGDAQAALESASRLTSEADRLSLLAMAHHDLGQAEDSDRALAALVAGYSSSWTSRIACVHAYRGEVDEALAWFRKAAELRDSGLYEDIFLSLLGTVRADPRWLPFLQSIGRSPAQLAAIDFEVSLPRPPRPDLP